MGKLAAEEAASLNYWFREKYNLPPLDVRFTSMTTEEIAVEYEMFLAAKGDALKTCFTCGQTTHRSQCPGCGLELTGDKAVDDVINRMERGEDFDLDAALRGEQWEPVQLGGA